jgi:CheY-like chemotaxis protein
MVRMQRGAEGALPLPASAGRVAGARILVVDDNETNREILEQQLHGWRAHCDSAGGADEAMKLLATSLTVDRPYDLVLLDMHMPNVDGIDLARMIRAQQAFDAVKLMVLSSVAMPADEKTLQELGIAGQLTKPIRQGQLYDCLSLVLNGDALAPRYSGQAPASIRALGGRVLLAEDNPVNQAVALGMLHALGLDVVAVVDGREALATASEQAFDLILMDCQMPLMDGLEATREIRRVEESQQRDRTPIVALTANAMVGDREHCLEAGMDEYLGKPFTKDQLHAVLSLYLRRPDGSAADEAPGEPDAGEIDAPLDRTVLSVLSDLQQPGGPSLVGKVIGIYLDSAQEIKDRLIAAIANVDRTVVRETAHALKSSSSNVGATRLAELCKRLERMAREDDLSGAESLQKDLEDEYPRVVEALQSELAAVAQ